MTGPEFAAPLLRAAARRRARRVVAGGALVGTLGAWAVNLAIPRVGARSCDWMTRDEFVHVTLAPALGVAVALLLLPRTDASSRVIAQGLLWSGLGLAAVACLDEPGLAPIAAPALALGCGVALFVLADLGLEPEKFEPPLARPPMRAAYGAVVTITIAALCSLGSVAFANRFGDGAGALDLPGIAAIAALAAAALALARLGPTGWFVAAGVHVAIAGLAVAGLLWMPPGLTYLLVGAAALVVGLALYLARNAARAEHDADPELFAHLAALARALALAAALALVGWSLWGVTASAIQIGCST